MNLEPLDSNVANAKYTWQSDSQNITHHAEETFKTIAQAFLDFERASGGEVEDAVLSTLPTRNYNNFAFVHR